MTRKQLPVFSPVTIGSVTAAFAATLVGGDRARARVSDLVRTEYAPKHLLLLDSGTSALALALLAVRRAAEALGRVPLVALPAYGCFDLATAAVAADVRVILYDLDPATLGPDWSSLERTLVHRPAAVVAAHLYGVPVDTARVQQLASAAGTIVVDDAAQGIGASAAGRPLGTSGSLGVLSFGRGKGRTGGGGGALLANDERGVALLEHVRGDAAPPHRGLKAAVQLKAQWLLGRPSLYWLPASLPFLSLGATPYHAPHRVRVMDDSCAAALAAAWDASSREVAWRRDAAHAWRRSPVTGDWHFPESDAVDSVRGELRLPVLVPEGQRAEDVARRLGGGAMPGYPASLALLPVIASRLESSTPTPGASTLVERLLTLPCHRYTVT